MITKFVELHYNYYFMLQNCFIQKNAPKNGVECHVTFCWLCAHVYIAGNEKRLDCLNRHRSPLQSLEMTIFGRLRKTVVSTPLLR